VALLWSIRSIAGAVTFGAPRHSRPDRAVYARGAASIVLALALLMSLQGAANAAGAGRVVVSATVGSQFTSTFADGSVTVASNVPWQVTADVPDGGRFSVLGDPTAGQTVDVPEGASGVAVFAR